MAFSILFIVFAVGWLIYEYMTSDGYHAVNKSKKEAKIEQEAAYKNRESKRKELRDSGWAVLESFAYDARTEEIMSKLREDDEDTLKRTGLTNPPLWSSIPSTYSNGQLFRNPSFFITINTIELSIINYNERIISSWDMIKGRFPNHERDLLFYGWMKSIYDLYMMNHEDFIANAGRCLSKDELSHRVEIVDSIIGNLPDPDYGTEPCPAAYLGRLSENKDSGGNWCVDIRNVRAVPYWHRESTSDELYDFLNGNNTQTDDGYDAEELD